MKNLGTVLSIIALAGVIYLLVQGGGAAATADSASEANDSTTTVSHTNGSLSIGFVISDSLVSQSEMHQKYQKIIQDKAAAIELELERRRSGLQENLSTLEQYMGTMTDEAIQRAQMEFQAEQQKFLQYQEMKGQEIALEQQGYSQIVSEHVDTIMEAIRVKHGLDFIFKKDPISDLLAANPANDITDIVVKELNEAYRKQEAEESK